jgi:eukaryotic-like serine/threonine-protein kinase
MANEKLIGPAAACTPSALLLSGTRSRGIPDDLLREASLRLGIMSLLGAILWTVGTLAGHLANAAMVRMGGKWATFDTTDVIAIVMVIASLALFGYSRRSKHAPGVILDIGLGYLVISALALGMLWHFGTPPPDYQFNTQISWVGALLLMFAAIVPTPPSKMLVVGLLAASMNPIAMMIMGARVSAHWGSPLTALVMHYPDYILVFVAVLISQVVTKLGQQVSKARELGSYQLGELIGRGGMGEVYKAKHRMLARPAAIKLIRAEMLGAADDETARLAITRFRREAEAAANLRSEHTVELYDFGVTADDTLYLVMEYLDGMDLETLVRQKGPLSPGRVTYILRQVCDSLDEAHSYGLVHRDIKPANIHLGRVGRKHDFVKVMDFGLVKAMADTTPDETMATIPGQMAVGTPAYMSPEMALGETVDARTDIYALGCVAYFLLTGELVFGGEKAVNLIAKHLQAEPVPPSQRTTQTIPPALERLIMKCLAKDPNRRPQSASEMSEALSWVSADAWGENQAKEWWNLNRNTGDSVSVSVPASAALPGAATRPIGAM